MPAFGIFSSGLLVWKDQAFSNWDCCAETHPWWGLKVLVCVLSWCGFHLFASLCPLLESCHMWLDYQLLYPFLLALLVSDLWEASSQFCVSRHIHTFGVHLKFPASKVCPAALRALGITWSSDNCVAIDFLSPPFPCLMVADGVIPEHEAWLMCLADVCVCVYMHVHECEESKRGLQFEM